MFKGSSITSGLCEGNRGNGDWVNGCRGWGVVGGALWWGREGGRQASRADRRELCLEPLGMSGFLSNKLHFTLFRDVFHLPRTSLRGDKYASFFNYFYTHLFHWLFFFFF